MNLARRIQNRLKLYPKVSRVIKRNRFSYNEIEKKSIVSLLNNAEYTINTIIGFRGRPEFHASIIESFHNAFKYYQNKHPDNKHTFCLTFVEHSRETTSREKLQGQVNYLWTPGNIVDQYSRSFAYNFGVKYSNKAKYYLLHDLDILVKENFFEELFNNLGSHKCMQPYGKKRVLYMSKELSEKVLKKEVDYNTFSENTPGVSPPKILGSKGGSILVEHDLYYKIGGFDPEIFWGYATEDQFFWEKLLIVNGDVPFADNPPIDMFHMWHPLTIASNPFLGAMNHYFKEFKTMPQIRKLKIIELQHNSFTANS